MARAGKALILPSASARGVSPACLFLPKAGIVSSWSNRSDRGQEHQLLLHTIWV